MVDDAPGKPQEEKEGGGEESTPNDAIEQDEQGRGERKRHIDMPDGCLRNLLWQRIIKINS